MSNAGYVLDPAQSAGSVENDDYEDGWRKINMARAVAEIERDILALSAVEKEALLNILISDLDVPSEEMSMLADKLIEATGRSSKALATAVSRLDSFDEEMRRVRIEARAAVLRSGETWSLEAASATSGD